MQLRYGLSVKEYTTLLQKQQGHCAICYVRFTTRLRPNIDHCHNTGAVRGLLCSLCNTGIGNLGDNQLIVKRSFYYLKETTPMKTQPELVLDYMRQRKTITQATASSVLAVSRLAAVIKRLKDKGTQINTRYIDGIKGRYAEYSLAI